MFVLNDLGFFKRGFFNSEKKEFVKVRRVFIVLTDIPQGDNLVFWGSDGTGTPSSSTSTVIEDNILTIKLQTVYGDERWESNDQLNEYLDRMLVRVFTQLSVDPQGVSIAYNANYPTFYQEEKENFLIKKYLSNRDKWRFFVGNHLIDIQ